MRKEEVCWFREDLEKTKYFRKVLDCWCVRRRGCKKENWNDDGYLENMDKKE